VIEKVTREEKEQELLQKAKILFIDGEINTVRDIAFLLERRFFSAGILSAVIDSDVMLQGLCIDCKDNKDEVLRRSIEVAKLFLHSGIIAICFGSYDSINTLNNHRNQSDFVLITTNKSNNAIENVIEISFDKSTLPEVVNALYKKLAASISQ